MPSHSASAARTEAIFRQVGALLENDHFVNIKGRHSSRWLDKDAVNSHLPLVKELCQLLWKASSPLEPEIICGPAIGGLIVAMWTAHLAGLPSVFAEHRPAKEEELRGKFELRRGYDALVKGKRVLVVDDVVNSGQSVLQTADAVSAAGGKVCGISCYVDCGNVPTETLGGSPYHYLLQWKIATWAEGEVPPEVSAHPVNVQHAHGAEYLARLTAKN